jgi:hypothetical protein
LSFTPNFFWIHSTTSGFRMYMYSTPMCWQ